MDILLTLNKLIAIIFIACYSYQMVYLAVSLLTRRRKFADGPQNRYAVLISARNEESVIAELIGSIRRQNYPADRLDVFVVADNCTDGTAKVARAAGATGVWERFDRQQVGKGYALRFLYRRIREELPGNYYSGYFVFDADNLLDENFVREADKVFGAGYRVVTGYRNSKNYGDNWISAGYALWFLREAQCLNKARMRLGVGCNVTGTGFLVHHEILERTGGWNCFLLTEDLEFTVNCVLDGEKIGYCADAVFYDEQPVEFRQSWNQRMRWAKGAWQVLGRYGGRLMKRFLATGDFSCFDYMMGIPPAMVLSFASVCVNLAAMVLSILRFDGAVLMSLTAMLQVVQNCGGTIFLLGLVTVLTEWRRIHCKPLRKLWSAVTLPAFMLTYIPIALISLFRKVEWKPIRHSVVKSVEEIRRGVN